MRDPGFISAVKNVPFEAAFLIGSDGLEALNARPNGVPGKPAEEPPVSKVFSDGGYYLLQGRGEGLSSRCFFDCGELGLGKTAAHGHADCLSVTVTVNGKDVLIDPGTFTYHSKPEWREYFRSTKAHNTISIDGVSQSVTLGPFVWGARAAPKIQDVAMETVFDFVMGSHDGYQRLSDPVKHTRAVVLLKPNFLIVADLLKAKGRHRYQQNFHLGGESFLAAGKNFVRIAAGPGLETLLHLSLLSKGAGELLSGKEEPIIGWRSRIFWEKEPCPCLSLSGEFTGAMILESCLQNVSANDSSGASVSFSEARPEGRAYSLIERETELFSERSLINLGKDMAGEGALESDATFVCVREFPGTGAMEIMGRNVGRVLSRGELVLEAFTLAVGKRHVVRIGADTEERCARRLSGGASSAKHRGNANAGRGHRH